jgi:hypothetical protein
MRHKPRRNWLDPTVTPNRHHYQQNAPLTTQRAKNPYDIQQTAQDSATTMDEPSPQATAISLV